MARTAGFLVVAAVIGLLLYWQVDVIHRGGIVMVPIVMCSVFSLAFTIERLYFFINLHLGADTDRRFETLRQAVEARRWAEAEALCSSWQGPVARVVLAGLTAREGTLQEIDQTMEDAAHSETPMLDEHMRSLVTLAQVSTLLGLLGTVTGLVQAFQVIQMKTSSGNPVSPGDLAGGVWEALITTVAGLSVAIPTILAYNYFASRVNEVQFQMERAASLISGWRQHAKR